MFWSTSRHLHECLEGGKPKCPGLGRPKVYIGRDLAWWGLGIQLLGLQFLLMPWLICVPPFLFVSVLYELVTGHLDILYLAWPMSQLLACTVFAGHNHVGLGVASLVDAYQSVHPALDAMRSQSGQTLLLSCGQPVWDPLLFCCTFPPSHPVLPGRSQQVSFFLQVFPWLIVLHASTNWCHMFVVVFQVFEHFWKIMICGWLTYFLLFSAVISPLSFNPWLLLLGCSLSLSLSLCLGCDSGVDVLSLSLGCSSPHSCVSVCFSPIAYCSPYFSCAALLIFNSCIFIV